MSKLTAMKGRFLENDAIDGEASGEVDSGFNKEELATTFAIVLCQSIIAICCQLFIVFTYARFRDLRKRSFELVLILACTSIIANVVYILAPKNETGSPFCTAQGFLMNFFDCAMVGWTTLIAYSLYCAVVLQKPSPSRFQMHAVVWTTCGVLSMLPLFTNSYGDGGPWCWIASKDTAGTVLRFVCFYIPLWIAFAVNAKIYYDVTQTLRRFAVLSSMAGGAVSDAASKSSGEHKLTKMANNLRWYPIIFVVAWSANTVIRVVQAFLPDYNSNYSFALVHVIFHGTFYQSVGNTFAYGYNEAVKEKWAGLLEELRSAGNCLPLCFLQANGEEGDAGREDDLEVPTRRATEMF